MIWPALMLAASRKHRVIGRNRILMVSIKINGTASQFGAPIGRRPAINFLKEGSLDKIRASHKGSPTGRVTIRWDVGLNEYGSMVPRFTLVNQINRETIKYDIIFSWAAVV